MSHRRRSSRDDRDADEGDEADEDLDDDSPRRASPSPPQAWSVTAIDVAVVIVATIAATTYAFRPANAGSLAVGFGLLVPFALAAALAVHRLKSRGELAEALAPKFGDLTFGAGAALLMYVAAMAISNVVAPQSSARGAWLATFYLHVAPAGLDLREVLSGRAAGPHHVPATFALVAFGCFELALRGLVFRPLAARLGAVLALLGTGALAAAAFAPAAVLLTAAGSGFNPIPVVFVFEAALIAGLVSLRSGRLLPSVIAVALFAAGLFEFPLWNATLPLYR